MGVVVRTRTTTGSFPARQIGAGAEDDVGHQARPCRSELRKSLNFLHARKRTASSFD